MEETISIEGKLLMLDDATPHVAVPVQAICGGEVIATTLSDKMGRYQFVDLKRERYQVRCQVLGGYVYYGEGGSTVADESRSVFLQVKPAVTRDNINFRFAPFKKGVWKTFTTLDGLAHNAVTDIHRDPSGVMWFATDEGGVSRYDGKEMVNLTTKDGLASNRVHCIYSDPGGTIWFGTEDGASRYDGKEFVNLTVEDGLPHNIVNDICRDLDGVMWLATEGGVSRYDGSKFTNLTAEDGLANNRVNAIYCDRDGAIWFATGGGVSRYDGREFVNLTMRDGLPSSNVCDIDGDPDGALWFATSYTSESGSLGGLSHYDGKEFVNFTPGDGLGNNWVWSVYVGPDGVIWLGTRSGVSRYDGRTFANFVPEDGLASGWVRSIYRDPDDVMWFGSGHTTMHIRGGVSRYDSKGLVNFTTKDGLLVDQAWAGYSDPDGTIWFGMWYNGGVSHYDGGKFVNFRKEDGLAGTAVGAIHRSADGMMWFGTDTGLSRYDGKEFLNFTGKDGLPARKDGGITADSHIVSIDSDTDGVLWLGLWFDAGLSRYDGKQFVSFNKEDGLAGDNVVAVHSDPDGVMWFGTWRGGLSRYDGRGFVNFTTADGLAGNAVVAIYRDPDGVMWFGTSNGLSRYDEKQFVNFTREDGLPTDRIWRSICRDSDGNLWVGTDGGGVCCHDGVVWTSLDTRDGLAGNTVSWVHQDSDGYLWFATNRGITRYRPNTMPPKIRIVSVTTDLVYRDLSAIPELTPGTRVTIEYNSIDFKTVPEKRQYRYRVYETGDVRHQTSDSRLKTSDVDLESQVSSLRSNVPYNPPTKEATFDWIPEKPGTYTLQVQAIDRDLNYSEPATLSLTVQPDPVLIELNHLRREVAGKYHFETIKGRSPGIRQVRALMERAIDSGLTVLITGETGTGKELVAKAIHYNSPRKAHPLLDRNCGAIPRELLASDLFGHRKGAFTGAQEDKAGLFEAASGGTVLLDEISEMPKDAQVHLLRVLEERKIRRLGENISRDVDVRIITMTNRDLVVEVEAGRFREDLFFRLSEFPIHVPPLRERPGDIPLLAEHFLQDYSQEHKKELDGFASSVLEVLQSYPWPGNVRELRNAIRQAAALAEEGSCIQTYHFSSQITQGESLIQEILSQRVGYSESVDGFRRRLVEHALRECDGNRTQAAKMLRMNRPNLIKLIKRFGIDI